VVDDRGNQPSEDEGQDDLVEMWHAQILLHPRNVRLGQMTRLAVGGPVPFVNRSSSLRSHSRSSR
jgi:hypothetical protein